MTAQRLDLANTHGSFGISVDVSDSSLEAPESARPDFDHEGGRGLWLIEALATRWGHTLTAETKSVWFTLAAPLERHAASDAGAPRAITRGSPVPATQ